MSLALSQNLFNTNSSFSSTAVIDDNHTPDHTEVLLTRLLGDSADTDRTSMDRRATDYSQSGIHSPYSHAFNEAQSEETTADHASAVQFTPQQQEVRAHSSNGFSASATPTSEYGVYPTSARSGSFPEHIQRQYHHPASNHSGSSGGGMAQPTNPSIAASSPTYPAHAGGQYSPYPPQSDMQHGYPSHPSGAMYAQPRPDWAGYAGQPHPMHGGYPAGAQTPTTPNPAGARPGQVYSFVPIPGAQQHKRPRRRYEEIERMYKCGWNGCEKAYGTLNHLNAHVTMQSHGQKRTPEEFKEIRKEWKARKKEEENQRKADEERQRATGPVEVQGDNAPPAGYSQAARPVQLPPIGYAPGASVPGQYQNPSGNVQQLQDYSANNHLQYGGYPASPYGAPNQI